MIMWIIQMKIITSLLIGAYAELDSNSSNTMLSSSTPTTGFEMNITNGFPLDERQTIQIIEQVNKDGKIDKIGV